jgi:hypothetical protein
VRHNEDLVDAWCLMLWVGQSVLRETLNRSSRESIWPALAAAMVGLGTLGAAGCERTKVGTIEVRPRHFDLRPGEAIHYLPLERVAGGELQFLDDYQLETSDPSVLELRDQGLCRALAPGRAELIVTSPQTQQRFDVQVEGPELPILQAVPHSEVDKIVGEEILFVGHANLDGFDHTAVAKLGIDRLVREFKASGRPVVYWVSEEFPDWYTEDRQPDLAVISEGQEHEILVDADRVVFTGGGFMFCTLRNVQMTLHGMIRAGTRAQLHFIFPPEAIWVGVLKPYPAPMVLLSSLLAKSDSDLERYDAVVVPFLDRLFNEYPVLDYPPNAPSPELGVLVEGWNVEVVIGDTFKRTYRRADSSKSIVMEFRTP